MYASMNMLYVRVEQLLAPMLHHLELLEDDLAHRWGKPCSSWCSGSDFDEDGIYAGKSVVAAGAMNVSGALRLFVGAEKSLAGCETV